MTARPKLPAISLRTLAAWAIILALLPLAARVGRTGDTRLAMLTAAALGGVLLLQRPTLGLPLLVIAALFVSVGFGTGTGVTLNAATLLLVALLGLWAVRSAVARRFPWARAQVNLPLALFVVSGLVSLAIGRLTWDPLVPFKSNFLLVQAAQWGIFALSAGAFWLTANHVKDERQLHALVFFFVAVAGGAAILRLLPGVGGLLNRATTAAFIRAPFWMLIFALALGQLLYNHTLRTGRRAFLVAVVAACLYYAFFQQKEAASNWVGLGAVTGILVWLRFPRLRALIVVLFIAMVLAGILAPTLYDFAGGEQEWEESGGSRLVLIERVVEVTMRNPITGLGPAAYRPYANMKPLPYMGAYWIDPLINSHNNYVDLFAHVGIVGLLLFGWFAWEIYRLGMRLHRRYRDGFLGGYVNAMLAAGAGSLVIMAFADWILPFVYNIGFEGLQASVLVWLFMGGLVAVDQWPAPAAACAANAGTAYSAAPVHSAASVRKLAHPARPLP